jgi:tripartite-type tricarboxylate transporter receptor subunit TctC
MLAPGGSGGKRRPALASRAPEHPPGGALRNGSCSARRGIDPAQGDVRMIRRRESLILPALAAAALSGRAARAQQGQAGGAWPNRTLRMVIPWPPGQATDIVGRLAAARLTETLGQNVVPENRPGAGGQIGTDMVAKGPADGYNILSASIGPISFSPLVQRTPYNVERELAPVTIFGFAPFMLLVKPEFPAQTVPAFLKLLKENPGKYTHNSSGIGGAQHLVTALFLGMAGVEALHVPFQGSGPALAALLGGQVDFGFDTPAAASRLVKEGQLKALGLTTAKPSAQVPGIPPLASVGGPAGYDVAGWNGLMVQAATPKPIIERIFVDIRDGMAIPAVRQRYEQVGFDVEPQNPEQMTATLKKYRDLFEPVIRRLGIRPE